MKLVPNLAAAAFACLLTGAIAQTTPAKKVEVQWFGHATFKITSPGGKVIVNRHQPSREIWVAAKSGGFHFRGGGGAWRDTREGTELGAKLSQLLQAQAGIGVELRVLPAPA